MTSLRERARARFEALGLPTSKDEAWRQTPIGPIVRARFEEAPSTPVNEGALEASGLLPPPGARVVFVDGRRSDALTSLADPGAGVSVRPLGEAGDGVVGTVAPWEDRAFAAWNTAAWADGALVEVAPGARPDRPIEIVHVQTTAPSPRAVFPRTLVRAGAGAEVVVVETFLSAGDGEHLTCPVTEIVAGENASVEHVKVQAEGDRAWHVASVFGLQARDARIVSHNVTLGAAIARNDVGSRLDGENASCALLGLTLAGGTRIVDNHTLLDHAKPHCPSVELYKSILDGSSRAVFSGRIIVREDAQKTDAKQSNRNLLLSRDALVFTQPQLEIYANDVKCTHGATIGKLDENQLFYLRSRGIGREEALDLLVHAFAGEVLDKIRDASVRDRVRKAFDRRLPGGGAA